MRIDDLRKLLEERLDQGSPFVTYHKPLSESFSTWLCDAPSRELRINLNKQGFVFSPFTADRDTVLFPLNDSSLIRSPFTRQEGKIKSVVGASTRDPGSNAGRQKHLLLVEKAVQIMQMGEVRKIVISRFEDVDSLEVGAVEIFFRLATLYPRAFSYLWFDPQVGLWVGSTPETLVRVRGKEFSTMSLAGTQVNPPSGEIVWQEKEREEQELVTELIREELGPMIREVGKPYTQIAGHLSHLRTDILGSIGENQDLNELLSKLHPTAAICGLPREKALDFIKLHEGYSRAYYTGFLGELNAPDLDESNLFVNLRCMEFLPRENAARIYVGGGITPSSNPEKEWEETQAKSETMKRVFS